MSLILALTLIVSHPETLLGGPSYVEETRTGHQYSEFSHSETYRSEHIERLPCQNRCEREVIPPLRVGDPIVLEPGFFDTPLSGGVGGQTGPIIIEHRGIIVIDGHAGRYGASRLHWIQP